MLDSFTYVERNGIMVAQRRRVNLAPGLAAWDEPEGDRVNVAPALGRVRYVHDGTTVQSTDSGGFTQLNLQTKDYDEAPGCVTDTEPFAFTVRDAGVYRVSASLFFASAVWEVGNVAELYLTENSVAVAALDRHTVYYDGGASIYVRAAGTTTRKVASGVALGLTVYHTRSAGDVNVYTGSNSYLFNYIDIEYLGIPPTSV